MNRLGRSERREQVLQAAVTVARRDGFNALTRSVVADEAGCAPATVNNAFGTMAELRREVATHVAGEGFTGDEADYSIVVSGLAYGHVTRDGLTARVREAITGQLFG